MIPFDELGVLGVPGGVPGVLGVVLIFGCSCTVALVGGLMPIPEEARRAGVPPMWMGYIGVDDVDGYAKRVKAAGGAIHRAAEDIPGIGRFAVAGDPDGAGFILFTGTSDQVPSPAPAGGGGYSTRS